VTLDRDLHEEKQWLKIVSTEEGTQIDRSDEQSENAKSPKCET
jgi:hypothetical protein